MQVEKGFLLSIDPSIKNSAFCLWKKVNKNEKNWIILEVFNISFKDLENKIEKVFQKIFEYVNTEHLNTNLIICIEQGIYNPKFGRGKETLDHLRGYICGRFGKLLKKEMLVSNIRWKKWYIDSKYKNISLKSWTKNISIEIANELITANKWPVIISNHDQADSVLIGWYYLNNDFK